MKLFAFRHNKFQASWSQFTEPNIYRSGYMYAEIIVLANNLDQAYEELAKEADWDLEEIKRLTPVIIELDQPKVLARMVHGG
jgi:hypothetical protein